jgi:autotransporter-associated beta strand protein
MTVDNYSEFTKGAGGAAGNTNMSIIPWIGAHIGTSATQTPNGFAVYDTTVTNTNGLNNEGVVGLRPLASSEYATSITAGSDQNVQIASFTALSGNTTVNSLRLTANATSVIGTGNTLTISSGGLWFNNNGGTLGGAGVATAGTVNFGTAEAVIWGVGQTSINTIGADITGSGGLTKAGIGKLVLAGNNNYSGQTTVAAGTLTVGNGTQSSNLGSGNVRVASFATLEIASGNGSAIADDATLTLDAYGFLNGKLLLNAGVNEVVGKLYLGDVLQVDGTYGSTASAATFKNDTYFSGTGIVTVPEPSAVALIGLGGMGLLRRRRAC